MDGPTAAGLLALLTLLQKYIHDVQQNLKGLWYRLYMVHASGKTTVSIGDRHQGGNLIFDSKLNVKMDYSRNANEVKTAS